MKIKGNLIKTSIGETQNLSKELNMFDFGTKGTKGLIPVPGSVHYDHVNAFIICTYCFVLLHFLVY